MAQGMLTKPDCGKPVARPRLEEVHLEVLESMRAGVPLVCSLYDKPTQAGSNWFCVRLGDRQIYKATFLRLLAFGAIGVDSIRSGLVSYRLVEMEADTE